MQSTINGEGASRNYIAAGKKLQAVFCTISVELVNDVLWCRSNIIEMYRHIRTLVTISAVLVDLRSFTGAEGRDELTIAVLLCYNVNSLYPQDGRMEE